MTNLLEKLAVRKISQELIILMDDFCLEYIATLSLNG